MALTRKEVTYKTTVPRASEESKRLNSYAAALMKRQSDMETSATEAEEKAWQEAKKRQAAKEGALKTA